MGKLSAQKREFFPYLLWRIPSLAFSFSQAEVSGATYQQRLEQAKEALWSFSRNADLRHGLCYSSHSFLERIDQYYQNRFQDRKKIRQTEDQLALWRNRMSLEAAPFSAFSRVGACRLSDGQAVIPAQSRVCFYHHLLFDCLKARIRKGKDFSREDAFILNSSFLDSGNTFCIITLDREGEHFRELEFSPVFNWLQQLFTRKTILFGQELCARLMEVSGTEEEEAFAFLEQLKDVGVILPLSNIPAAEREWPKFMLEEKAQWEDKPAVKVVLKELQGFPSALSGSGPEEKVKKQRSLYRKLEGLDLAEGLSPERLLYENRASESVLPLAPGDWARSFDRVFDFADFLFDYFPDPQGLRLRKFAEMLVRGKKGAPFLRFYSKWREQEADLSIHLSPFIFREEMFRTSGRGLELKLEAIGKWFPRPSLSEPFRSRSLSAIAAPFFDDEAGPSLRLISYSLGAGRLWGRFRPFFPGALDEIDGRNRALYRDGKACIVSDLSTYLAFDEKGLLPYEITLPGGASKYSPEKQIPLKDLWVEWDDEKKEPFLMDIQDGRRVFPLDLSLEGRATRSPLYRVLCSFGGSAPFLGGFLESLTIFLQENYRTACPSVYFEESVLLKPAGRLLNKGQIPLRNKGQTHASFFAWLAQWRRKESIGRFAWWKSESARPLFVDFEDPVLVRCLASWLQKAGEELWVDEMAPRPGQFLKSAGEERYVEWVIEN